MEEKEKNFKKILTKIGLFKDNHVTNGTIIIFGLAPFLFIVYLLLGPVIRVIKKDIKSEPMYIISDNLNLRSETSPNAYIIGNFNYGTEVKVYNTYDNLWAEVTIGKKKGYMSLEYLVPQKIFYLIDGMFGNELAKKALKKTAYKKALANYFLNNQLVSDIPEDIKVDLYGKKAKNKTPWQFFVLPGKKQFNSYCYGDFNGDKKRDVAFIITNLKTKQNRLIVLSINEFSQDYGTTLFSMDLKDNWYYIRLAPKNYKFYIDGELKPLPIDGILIGSNRDPQLQDPVQLLLYDGEKFKLHKQPKK